LSLGKRQAAVRGSARRAWPAARLHRAAEV